MMVQQRGGGRPPMRHQPSIQELRELAYELLRRIEHQLGDIRRENDARIADTIAECEEVLSEIKAHLQPKD